MWHRSQGEWVGGRECLGGGRGEKRKGGSKGEKVNILQFPSPLVSHQFCNTIAQESSRTDKRRCSHIHIKLSMYNCIQRRAPPTTSTNT